MIKFKVKRSDWFEGLLQAEELTRTGHSIDIQRPDSPYLWFKDESGGSLHGITIHSKRFFGVADYMEYYYKNIDIIDKHLTK